MCGRRPAHSPLRCAPPPGYTLHRPAPPDISRRRAARQAHPSRLRLLARVSHATMAASSPKSTAAFVDSVAELQRLLADLGGVGRETTLRKERGARAPSTRSDHQAEVGERGVWAAPLLRASRSCRSNVEAFLYTVADAVQMMRGRRRGGATPSRRRCRGATRLTPLTSPKVSSPALFIEVEGY